ncbi:uncharacterized protein LOC134265880 [Saccostrea cucullata]|uniref:uncharacterized protein LOC134265880 n=1 Tax=Saccostrea cuccullata TaxID=36930 RepID=UPI002ED1B906
MRRDFIDLSDMLTSLFNPQAYLRLMFSGSHREGFRLVESDRDSMYWPKNHRVIWNLSQSQLYSRKTLILSDCSQSPPGFALLQLLFPAITTIQIRSSCFTLNGKEYISSSEFRNILPPMTGKPKCHIHGPCKSGTFLGVEFDDAICFASDFWPPSAQAWIDRCHSWPSPHVVDDIVRNGCHFVAIGHKLGNHAENEWRISFSLAEQKLVYSMNHCQFLTYGLLKLILKEVIKERIEESLLCSYHMKTAVFWAIQQNLIPHWYPENFLKCFWVCFKLLLKWVYEGVCPNFFIPENNMFLTNIFGESQRKLFLELYGLYEKGMALLLHSHSIRSTIIIGLCLPGVRINTAKDDEEILFDLNFLFELESNNPIVRPTLNRCFEFQKILETLMNGKLTNYQVLLVQNLTVINLQCTAFVLCNRCANTAENKLVYKADKISCYMLKLAAKLGSISDILYLAMYHYKTFRYMKAISVLQIAKIYFAQPYVMHSRYFNSERYIEAFGGQSSETKMRRALAKDVILYRDIYYINELTHEQCSETFIATIMNISPFVMLHMLEFLCYRHCDEHLAEDALNDLQIFVKQGKIHPGYRDICWQILGICQQLRGDFPSALYSYRQSLRQYPTHSLQNVTLRRIHDIV